jgi:hypothetical protein
MVLAWLIFTQLVALLSLLPWVVLAGLAVMAFDSGVSWQALLFVGVIWGYPLVPIASAIIAWIAYFRGSSTTALISTSVPLLIALPLIIYLVYTQS